MPQLGRSAVLTGFLDLSREVGLDAYALATSAGLPTEVLTNPDLRVSVEAMGRMWEMAADQSGLEDFALRVGETRGMSNLGAVGLVIREQPTVRKALQAYTRFQWLQNDAFHLVIELVGDQATLRFNGPTWLTRQTADVSLATAVRALKALLGERWRPLEVWFTHAAPAKLDAYRRVFGVTPSFDEDCLAIVMTRADLDTAIPAADPTIARQLAQHLEQLTERRRVDLAAKVGDLIVALLPDGVCSVERIAQHLAMDRRTLHRRLLAEGKTYTGILDDKRRDLAASLLTASDRPLQHVAGLLGFSSMSAFAHWFRRRFAQSASAYRTQRAVRAMRVLTRQADHRA